MKVLKMIFAIPISLIGFFILDFVSPYLSILINILEGNNPNGLIYIITEICLDLIIFPILSVYFAAYLFGKLFPLIKQKYIVSIVYMAALVILSCFLLFSQIFITRILWQGILKFSVYVIASILALIYAVKSHEVFANKLPDTI